jgi:hypothetical protein
MGFMAHGMLQKNGSASGLAYTGSRKNPVKIENSGNNQPPGRLEGYHAMALTWL